MGLDEKKFEPECCYALHIHDLLLEISRAEIYGLTVFDETTMATLFFLLKIQSELKKSSLDLESF